jgi:predicted nucleic acid-binding protein
VAAAKMILCDTNILIEFYKGNHQILGTLRHIGLVNLAVSVVTVGELFYGAKDRRELSKIQVHLSQIQQIALDEDISTDFVNLLGKYALSHKLSVPDALIASTAITKDMPIYTLNVKDFRYIPGLKLYETTEK